MNWFRGVGLWVLGLVWLAAGVGHACAGEKPSKAETVVIPLDQIWALHMPGARTLTPERSGPQSEFVSDEGPTVEKIYASLQKMEYDKQFSPGFAVLGTGNEALSHANDVLARRQKRRAHFTTNDEVSLVFFARGRHEHVYLRKVEHMFGLVRIQYQLVPYLISPQTTIHFALIPLGNIPEGEMKVEMVCLPMEKQPNNSTYKSPSQALISQIVSPSFQITISKPVANRTKNKELWNLRSQVPFWGQACLALETVLDTSLPTSLPKREKVPGTVAPSGKVNSRRTWL